MTAALPDKFKPTLNSNAPRPNSNNKFFQIIEKNKDSAFYVTVMKAADVITEKPKLVAQLKVISNPMEDAYYTDNFIITKALHDVALLSDDEYAYLINQFNLQLDSSWVSKQNEIFQIMNRGPSQWQSALQKIMGVDRLEDQLSLIISNGWSDECGVMNSMSRDYDYFNLGTKYDRQTKKVSFYNQIDPEQAPITFRDYQAVIVATNQYKEEVKKMDKQNGQEELKRIFELQGDDFEVLINEAKQKVPYMSINDFIGLFQGVRWSAAQDYYISQSYRDDGGEYIEVMKI